MTTAAVDSIYRLIIDEAVDYAIFLLDAQGHIQTWNRGAQRIFGYTAENIIGRHFSLLFMPADREIGTPEKELRSAAASGRAEDTRWHVRADGRAFFADGVTTAIRADGGPVTGFAKIARDVTDRFRTEQRLAAQLALTSLLNQNEPATVVARQVMQTVCEHLGWDIGALWFANEERGTMEPIDYWHAPHVDAAAARELCAGHTFRRGEGIPGIAWETSDVFWVADMTDASRFPRARFAAAAGMHAAFAFPIMHNGRVKGVMEFFSREQREPDQPLMPVMTLIGAQVGDYIDARQIIEALRESEERYRLISETAQDAIFTIDEHSTVLSCNPAVQRIFGYEPGELVGKPLDTIIPERMREAHRRGMQRYLRTRQRNIPWTGIELPALRKDGSEFPAELSFGEWRSDRGTIFSGYARDITERKRGAEQLEESLAEAHAAREQLQRRADEEAAFRHLASALSGAVEMSEVLYEIVNRATQVTRADGVYVERIVGPDHTVEVVAAAGRGTPARGLRVGYPGSMSEEILSNRQPVILTDMRGFGRHMAPYLADVCGDCQVLVTPIVAEDEPLGALVLLNSRQSGRQFGDPDVVRARTLGDLASLALRRVRLLEQEREAKEKAEAAVRVRDETLGIVSHDLRNPLTKVVLSADLLDGAAPDEQPDLVETIRAAAKQMDRLIQDLLDVARLEAGRFSVQKELLDTTALVTEVCASYTPLAEQKSQRVVCQTAPDLPRICADRDRMLQVFGNLIGNSIKFTPERGTITVEADVVREGVRFRIADTGPGIGETDLKNIFRPYYQAKKTAHMGAGLGLAIVRGIVEAHGGTVTASNAPGGGALFTVVLPPG